MTRIYKYAGYTNRTEMQKNRLCEYANHVQTLKEDLPRSISLEWPARLSTAIRKNKTVTPAPIARPATRPRITTH